MRLKLSKLLVTFLASSLPVLFFLNSKPLLAVSELAAWQLSSKGELKLRTSKNAILKAFFQYPDSSKGSRIWIDFQGELIRPRRIRGNGVVREIRLGKPKQGITRLVVEFKPSVVFTPSELKLVGIAPDLWRLKLGGLPSGSFKTIGEGMLNRSTQRTIKNDDWHLSTLRKYQYDLPSVARGKYRVVIDPGHGGPDSGAIGIGGVRETDVVLDISLRVARLLEDKGVKVKLTRTSEIDLDLPPRVAMANRIRANAFVSIHANASRTVRKDVNGIETFYFSGKQGYRLAANIQRELLKASPGSPDRGVRRGRFFVIRRTSMPAALVEAGFLTGRFDGPLLASVSHRRKISFAIAKGIINYLKGFN